MQTKTLRDEFAMAAMTGMLADKYWQNEGFLADFATSAYAHADAMLEAREEQPTSPSPDLQGELVARLREARREIQLVHDKDGLVYDPTLIAAIDAILAKLPAETTNQE